MKQTKTTTMNTTIDLDDDNNYPPPPPLPLDYKQAYHKPTPERARHLTVSLLAVVMHPTDLQAFIELIGGIAFEPDADVRAVLAAEAINAALANTGLAVIGLRQIFLSQPAEL